MTPRGVWHSNWTICSPFNWFCANFPPPFHPSAAHNKPFLYTAESKGKEGARGRKWGKGLHQKWMKPRVAWLWGIQRGSFTVVCKTYFYAKFASPFFLASYNNPIVYCRELGGKEGADAEDGNSSNVADTLVCMTLGLSKWNIRSLLNQFYSNIFPSFYPTSYTRPSWPGPSRCTTCASSRPCVCNRDLKFDM